MTRENPAAGDPNLEAMSETYRRERRGFTTVVEDGKEDQNSVVGIAGSLAGATAFAGRYKADWRWLRIEGELFSRVHLNWQSQR